MTSPRSAGAGPDRLAGPSGLRDTVGSLTFRGRAFLAGGTTAAICGVLLGERDLVRVGAVILLLPLVATAFAARSGQRLTLVRALPQPQTEVHRPATVRLDLTNPGARTGVLMAEDYVPWALGDRPRFILDPIRSQEHRVIEYDVRAEVRGIYEIGPLRLRTTDPFGMLDVQRSFSRSATLVVTPATEPLPSIALPGARTGNGEDRPRAFSHGNAADVTVREYRLGDDLRRVHWRSSARTGELMVRREEEPWQARCTLFLDNRETAHRGTGADSSFERAITAAASVAVHLAEQGFQVRLVSADGSQFDHGLHQGNVAAHARPVLEHLAALHSTSTAELGTGWIDESVTTGMFIGVFGALTARDHLFLARVRTRGAAPNAITLAVGDWTSRSEGTASATDAAWLREHGWKASVLTRSGSLPHAWQELSR